VLLVWFAATAANPSLLRSEEPETLTVCEVIQNLESLDGKMVAIRGELYSGDHEAVLLPTKTCPKERRRDGIIWHPRIHLLFPVKEDQALESIRRRVMATMGDEPYWKFRVVATYIGRLSTKWDEVYSMPDGSLRGGGFGFLEASPTELWIVTGKDVEVSRDGEEDEPKERQ